MNLLTSWILAIISLLVALYAIVRLKKHWESWWIMAGIFIVLFIGFLIYSLLTLFFVFSMD